MRFRPLLAHVPTTVPTTVLAAGLSLIAIVFNEWQRRRELSLLLSGQLRAHACSVRRVIVAVSGTIQDGFELRTNIDYHADDGSCTEAVYLGTGLVRGVTMYLDIKRPPCREYDASVPHRINPAILLSGSPLSANRYALYLVDERACVAALLGEPRLLAMVPDAVQIDLLCGASG